MQSPPQPQRGESIEASADYGDPSFDRLRTSGVGDWATLQGALSRRGCGPGGRVTLRAAGGWALDRCPNVVSLSKHRRITATRPSTGSGPAVWVIERLCKGQLSAGGVAVPLDDCVNFGFAVKGGYRKGKGFWGVGAADEAQGLLVLALS